MKAPFRVAVVGSGTSGLAAATELASAKAEREIEITVFDARSIAGGRTRSFVEKKTGDIIDNGQHLMMGCYTATLRYLRQIGTISMLRVENPLSIPYFRKGIGHVGTFSVPTNLPSPANLLFGLLQSDLLATYEKMAALRFGAGIMSFRYDMPFANNTCMQLFAATHQPDSLIEKLWEPVILATMNTPVAEASAQVFLNVIRTIFLMNRTFSTLLVPAVGLSDLLIDPAILRLRTSGHYVRLGEEIVSADERAGVIYVRTNSNDTYQTFDAMIIAASPLPAWAREFSDVTVDPLFSPIVNLYLWVDKEILSHSINGFLGTTVQWAFPKYSSYSKQLIACTVSAARDLAGSDQEEIIFKIESDIRSSLPGASYFSLEHAIVLKEKRATYLLNTATETGRPHCRTSSLNVFWASDLASNGLPFTIEGAIRNGVRAAETLLREKLFIEPAETHWAENRISVIPRSSIN